MRLNLNGGLISIGENYLFCEIDKRVEKYKSEHKKADIINMGIGDVTMPLSKTVVNAMKRACNDMKKCETFHGYPPVSGYEFLKIAIVNYYKKKAVSIDKNDIFVSDGAKCDIGNITEIFGSNEVYIQNPTYPVYLDSNLMASRKVKFMDATQANSFLPMPKEEYGTGIYYLCSPNNPTGATYNKIQLQKWVDFALATGSFIVFDAAYESFIADDFPHSIYEVSGADKCAAEFCSFSKTAGFTGVRCSYTVIPSTLTVGSIKLADLWARRQSTKSNGVSYISQAGAAAAYSDNGYSECKKNINYYMQNARLISEFLLSKGINHIGGKNAPYIWFTCPENMTSWEFFDFLLASAEIVGTPGAGFGTCGEGYFRLSAFSTRKNTEKALKRLECVL